MRKDARIKEETTKARTHVLCGWTSFLRGNVVAAVGIGTGIGTGTGNESGSEAAGDIVVAGTPVAGGTGNGTGTGTGKDMGGIEEAEEEEDDAAAAAATGEGAGTAEEYKTPPDWSVPDDD